MKKYILLVMLSLCFTGVLSAQEWYTDFETAKKISASRGYPILLVFQGSDWCAPCIKLDRTVFKSDTFKEYARTHFVMLKADFPRKKTNALSPELQERNNKLAEAYNKKGIFPLVVLLDSEGHVLGKAGYEKMTPQEYINHLESLN